MWPGALEIKQCCVLDGEAEIDGATIALNGFEHGFGIKAFKENERRADIHPGESGNNAAHMRQR